MPRQPAEAADSQQPGIEQFMTTTVQALQALTNSANVLNSSTADLQAAVVNPSNIATLTQTVGRFGRQPIPPFNAACPHKWAKDARSIIMGWSDDHCNSITDDPVTNLNTNPPTLIWANTDDRLYKISKEVALKLYPTLPLSKQVKIDTAISALNNSRHDELLRFSAHHYCNVILEFSEQLASAHFTNLENCKLVNSAQLPNWLIIIKTIKDNYFGALPESQHDMRDLDTAKQIVKNLPPDLQAVVDQQLFNTPDTARTTAQVFDVLDRKASFMRARGQSLSQFPPPTGAPVNVHAQPVQMPAIANSLGNFVESDEAHWLGDEHAHMFMGDAADAPGYPTDDTYSHDEHANALQGMRARGRGRGFAPWSPFRGRGRGGLSRGVAKPGPSHYQLPGTVPSVTIGKGRGGKVKGKTVKGKQPTSPCNICSAWPWAQRTRHCHLDDHIHTTC